MKLSGHKIVMYLPVPFWFSQGIWSSVDKDHQVPIAVVVGHFAVIYLVFLAVSIYLIRHYDRNRKLIALAAIPFVNYFVYGVVLASAEKREAEHSRSLAPQIAADYSLRYLLDHGSQPSRDTVANWLIRLNTLDEAEMLRLSGDPESLKRFLG